VVNAIYLPAAFLAGAFFSPHHFPSVLRAIADVLPLTYFLRLVRNVMLHGHDIWSQGTNVAVVAAWGILGVIIALRAFRWEPHEGRAGRPGEGRRAMTAEPQLAFCVREVEPPGVEVRVNFGVFAGRRATPAEIDELAKVLLPKVGEV